LFISSAALPAAVKKLPPERLFLAAPKMNALPDPWTPRADLSLKVE
jgi:hypothetical protein